MMWQQAIPTAPTGARAKAGGLAADCMDSDAFAAFYERSARSLWAYIARCSGDATLAEDIMQESYVRFLGASRPDEGDVAARRYLFRIATNLLRDHWRHPHPTSISELPESLFASGLEASQLHAQIQLARAMAHMRPRDRQLLWLAHAENYTHHEIAEITGLATTSIRLILFRARRRIKQLMENEPKQQMEDTGSQR